MDFLPALPSMAKRSPGKSFAFSGQHRLTLSGAKLIFSSERFHQAAIHGFSSCFAIHGKAFAGKKLCFFWAAPAHPLRGEWSIPDIWVT
jgi:hypothetical protein